MNRLLFFLALLLLFTACNSSKSVSPEALARQQKVFDKVEARDFTIQVNTAVPSRWKSVSLSSYYDLTLRNDSAFAHLPFFGRAYMAPIGEDGGIKFSEPLSDYRAELNSKGDGMEIFFAVKSRGTHYKVYLSVFNNGLSSLRISSLNRDPMSYSGEMVLE